MAQWELCGAFPGAFGEAAAMHARYYHARWGLDRSFELEVGGELFEFAGRYDPDRDLVVAARCDGLLVGFLVVDGALAQDEGARLRWFIVDEGQCGKGLGKALLGRAMDFASEKGYSRVFLWTYAGLDAARALYDRNGFCEECVVSGKKWGRELCMQKLVARL